MEVAMGAEKAHKYVKNSDQKSKWMPQRITHNKNNLKFTDLTCVYLIHKTVKASKEQNLLSSSPLYWRKMMKQNFKKNEVTNLKTCSTFYHKQLEKNKKLKSQKVFWNWSKF